MAHPSTSRLQGSDQTTLGLPQGQPAYTFFPNARDFSIVGAVFNDVHHHAEGTANGNVASCSSLSVSHLTDLSSLP